MIPVKFPKWHDDARKMKASGMTTAQIAMALADAGITVSESRVRFATADNWELATGREKARLDAKDRELALAKKEGRLPNVKEAMIKAYDDFNKQWQEREMSDRQFDLYVPEGQARDNRNRVRIACSHNGCTQAIVFAKPGPISPVHAKNWFNDKGWYVGKTPTADLCPDHYHHDAKPKRVVETTAASPPPVHVEEAVLPASYPPPPPVLPLQDFIPKQDKRVIISKLEEVYEDEDRGYRRGWNDAKVATDLGVEQGWVELVRAAIFGPAFSEADAEEVLLKQGIEDHYSRIVGLTSGLGDLMRMVGELMNELDGMIFKYRKLTDGK